MFAALTNGRNSGSSLIKHSNSLGQQQLSLWNNCEDTQDVKGVTHSITPAGDKRITTSQ